MAKFAVGDFVAKGKTTGRVVAIFTTTDGQLRYAIEDDVALQFAMENELAQYQSRERAA